MTSAPPFIATTEWGKDDVSCSLVRLGDPPARTKRGVKGAASSFAPPFYDWDGALMTATDVTKRFVRADRFRMSYGITSSLARCSREPLGSALLIGDKPPATAIPDAPPQWSPARRRSARIRAAVATGVGCSWASYGGLHSDRREGPAMWSHHQSPLCDHPVRESVEGCDVRLNRLGTS